MEAFLTRLALTGLSAATQDQAFNALLFLYREGLRQPLDSIAPLRGTCSGARFEKVLKWFEKKRGEQ